MQRLLLIVFSFASPLLASSLEVDSIGTIIRSLGVPGITAALLWNLLARSDKRYEVLFAKHQEMHAEMLQVLRENSAVLSRHELSHEYRGFNQDPAGRD